MNERKATEREARAIRRAMRWQGAPVRSTMAFWVRAGTDAPREVGREQHYVTPAGKRVWYPSAYRRAFGRPIYVPSTVRVVVGAAWLGRRLAK